MKKSKFEQGVPTNFVQDCVREVKKKSSDFTFSII